MCVFFSKFQHDCVFVLFCMYFCFVSGGEEDVESIEADGAQVDQAVSTIWKESLKTNIERNIKKGRKQFFW